MGTKNRPIGTEHSGEWGRFGRITALLLNMLIEAKRWWRPHVVEIDVRDC